MAHNRSRLVATAAAGAVLLGLTTSAAQAAGPREATAGLYAFIGSGGGQESVAIENQLWSQPEHVAHRTPAHPGWSIHLSDETVGAGLPKQNIRANAGQGETYETFAWTRGFISLVDGSSVGTPFLVFRFGGDNVVCEGLVGYEVPRLFVRKANGELYEATDLTKPAVAEYVTSADSAAIATAGTVTVEAKRVTSAAQIAAYGPFAKYATRERVRTDGFELVLTHKDAATGTPKTHRLLAGAQAVSC
ncbi:hypothetical protein [Lentzea sp. NEAU-D7]|uniref:hypothetical protein n=1 Tax=Lentzea sp. NEAU-D7 TaxID=2994667 RepID=UPI00224B84A5|nr:hypothetical protein [Lentzea sp. NEAU-D7]MCX2949556.1 hypothetical protein [Lentzea sp. NEAU-D7]